ncbi:MAG: 50S ribosomal protein L21 [Conexivisphaerales archaeon]
MPHHRGFRRKTRSVLTSRSKPGLSRLMTDYDVGQKVAIDIEPSQEKGMPHRRFQGLVGIVKEVRLRALVIDVPVGNKTKRIIARFEHIKPIG